MRVVFLKAKDKIIYATNITGTAIHFNKTALTTATIINIHFDMFSLKPYELNFRLISGSLEIISQLITSMTG